MSGNHNMYASGSGDGQRSGWRKRTIAEMAREAEQDTVQRLSALVRAQQITIDKLEAQSEQEPCGGCGGSGWVPRDPDIGTDQECFTCNGSGVQPNEPAQRTWLGLTDEEAVQTWEGVIKYAPGDVRIKDFARAIEAKLKEKNTP